MGGGLRLLGSPGTPVQVSACDDDDFWYGEVEAAAPLTSAVI